MKDNNNNIIGQLVSGSTRDESMPVFEKIGDLDLVSEYENFTLCLNVG